MATTNPVLSRSGAFSPTPTGFQPDAYYNPQTQYQNPQAGYGAQGGNYAPGYGAPAGYGAQGYGAQGFQAVPQAGRMTMDDVIIKTAMLLLGVIGAGALTMVLLPLELSAPVVVVAGIVSFVTVMVVAGRRTMPVAGLFVYALVEGILLGALSKVFEVMYPGIVMPAVIGTLFATLAVLATYKFLGARVNGRLGKIVTVSIIAYAALALVNLVLIMFGGGLSIFAIGAAAGPMAWVFSGIGIVLAAASMLQDFEAIENGVRNGAPESESWRGAFGLVVTMVWMYTNILRILSYFRN